MASDRTLTFANGRQLAKLNHSRVSLVEEKCRKGESESREHAILDKCTGAEPAASHMPTLTKIEEIEWSEGKKPLLKWDLGSETCRLAGKLAGISPRG